MGAETPVTTKSTSGYVDPNMPGAYGGVNAGGVSLITTVQAATDKAGFTANIMGLKFQNFFFAAIDNGSTWASGIPNIKHMWVAGDDIDTDRVACTLTDAATGAVEFGSENANTPCWVLVASGG
jgi:hypothetical protein